MPSPKAAEGSARKLDRKVSSLRRRRSIGGSGELNGAAADADSGRLLVDQVRLLGGNADHGRSSGG